MAAARREEAEKACDFDDTSASSRRRLPQPKTFMSIDLPQSSGKVAAYLEAFESIARRRRRLVTGVRYSPRHWRENENIITCFYTDRAAGSDRYHRHPGGALVAG